MLALITNLGVMAGIGTDIARVSGIVEPAENIVSVVGLGGLLITLTLLILLAELEIVSASNGSGRQVNYLLYAAAIPLLLVFAAMLMFEIARLELL